MCKAFDERGLRAVEVRSRYFDKGGRTTLICRPCDGGAFAVGRKAYNAAAKRLELSLTDVLESSEDGRLIYAGA